MSFTIPSLEIVNEIQNQTEATSTFTWLFSNL